MRRKKIFSILFVIVAALCCAFGLAACGGNNNNNNQTDGGGGGNSQTPDNPGGGNNNNPGGGENNNPGGGDTPIAHTHTFSHVDAVAAGCTVDGNCEYWFCADCGKYFSDANGNTEIAQSSTVLTAAHTPEALTGYAATCTTAGLTDGSHCKVCKQILEEQKAIPALQHHFELDEEHSVKAGCTNHGENIYVCSNAGCKESYSQQVKAYGHKWDIEAPTCTKGQTCSECNATIPALGHSYALNSSECQPVSCEQAGKEVYSCTHEGCEEGYVNVIPASGHAIAQWDMVADSRTATDTPCVYEYTLTGMCSNCHSPVNKTTTQTEHSLRYDSILRAATCKADGEKKYVCTDCDHFETEPYSNSSAHNYVESVAGNKVTYTCSHDSTHTYTALVCNESSADLSVDELLETPSVQLSGGTTIRFPESALSNLPAEGINLSAQVQDKNSLGLSSDALAQIGDAQVFDLSTGNAEFNQNLGGEGVEVSLPYVLQAGEDPDDIAIWYIDDYGQTQTYKGVYSNGAVVFTATHFSLYTVTRLTPQQRCELYGHNAVSTVINPTCLTGGYTQVYCKRCGLNEIVDKVAALGHDIQEHVDSEATCTANGSSTYSCSRCDHSYVVVTVAPGHDWQVKDSVSATCTAAGHIDYECGVCQEKYVQTLAQKQHAYAGEAVAATCTEIGYTAYTCTLCGHSYNGSYVPAKGHSYIDTVVAPTCTEKGYTLHECTACDHSFISDETPAAHIWDIAEATCGQGQKCIVCGTAGAAATGNHKLANGVCTVCGHGCSHANTTTKQVAATCTEIGYTEVTCTECGLSTRSDYTPATGHSGIVICETCGEHLIAENFFINTLKGLVEEKYTIVVKDVEIDMATAVSSLYAASDINIKIKLAEMCVHFDEENGLVCRGYADIDVDSEDVYVGGRSKATIILARGKLYMKAELSGDSNQTQWTVIPINEDTITMISSNMGGMMEALDMELIGQILTDLAGWIENDLQPLLATVSTITGSDVNAMLEKQVINFCDVEKTALGYSITLSGEKIAALYADLCTEGVATVINKLIGENFYEALVEKVCGVLDTTFGDYLKKALAEGKSVEDIETCLDDLIDVVWKYMPIIGDMLPGGGNGGGTKPEDGTEQGGNNGNNTGGGDRPIEQPEVKPYALEDEEEEATVPTFNQLVTMLLQSQGILKPDEQFNLLTILKNPELLALTPLDLLNGYLAGAMGIQLTTKSLIAEETTPAEGSAPAEEGPVVISIPDVAATYGEIVVMPIIAGMVGVPEDEIAGWLEGIGEMIGGVLSFVDVTANTNSNGVITSATVKVDMEGMFNAKGEIALIKDYSSSHDYEAVIAEATDLYNGIVLDEITLKALFGKDAEITVDEETGNYNVSATKEKNRLEEVIPIRQIMEVPPQLRKLDLYVAAYRVEKQAGLYVISSKPMINFGADCGYWYSVSINVYSSLNVMSGEKLVLSDANGVEITDESILAQCAEIIARLEEYSHLSGHHSDGYSLVNFMYDSNNNKYEVNDESHTKHNYVEDKALYKSPTTCEEYGERHYVCTICGDSYVSYFYVWHSYETYYTLKKGATSCFDGVECVTKCALCGKVYENDKNNGNNTEHGGSDDKSKYYSHYTGVSKVIDLSKYGAEYGSYIVAYGCPCGTVSSRPLWVRSGYEYFEENTLYDYKGESLKVYSSANLTFSIAIYTVDCKLMAKVIINCDAETGEAAKDSVTLEEFVAGYRHSEQAYTSLLDGSETCEDGVRVEYKCLNCGKTVAASEGERWHMRGIIRSIDLAPYGATCGEKLMVQGCACGEIETEYKLQSEKQNDIEEICVYYNNYYDYKYIYKCAVTNPKCDLVYSVESYIVDNKCTRTVYFKFLLGCDENGENAQDEISVVRRVETNHMYAQVEGSKKPVAGQLCTYTVTLACLECGKTRESRITEHAELVEKVDGCVTSYVCPVCDYVMYRNTNHLWDTAPTCTQFAHASCLKCGERETFRPNGHKWEYNDEFGMYVCRACGLQNENGSNGYVVLEDCSEEGSPEKIVGYYFLHCNEDDQDYYRHGFRPYVYVTFYGFDGEDVFEIGAAALDVPVSRSENGNRVAFSYGEAVNGVYSYLDECGDEVKDVAFAMISIAMVPEGNFSELEYAITFNNPDDVIVFELG